MWASENGNIELVELLLSAGAKVDLKDRVREIIIVVVMIGF